MNTPKFDLLNRLLILANGSINKEDLTGTAYSNNISKLELSKLNNNRLCTIFEERFYKMLNPFIKAHRYDIYNNHTVCCII